MFDLMQSGFGVAGIGMLLLAQGLGCQSAAGNKVGGGGAGNSAHAGGSGAGQGSSSGTGGSSARPSASITLNGATAHVDGRLGNRVRLTITGQQTLGTFASVAVTAFDSSGNSINWFDTNLDSTLDSSTGFLVPQVIPNETTFSFDLLVPISKALLDWTQAKISLYDRADAVSNELSIPVDKQPQRSSGQACDPASKTDRCQDGLECSAASSTCVSHAGPSLTQVAYVSTTNGPMLLAAGADNADDVIEMKLGFQDAKGAPVLVNIDNNDQNQLASSITESTGYSITDGTFLFHVDPATAFSQVVNKVTFVAVDANSNSSTMLTGTLVPAPSRGSGATCDYRGFNYCSGNSACVPGTAGASNTCQPMGSAQNAVCKLVPVLDPTSSNVIVTGYNLGSSLWEPPTDCVSNIAFHHPESVIKLHLPSQVPSLTLTTNRRETQVDTVVYVASACSPTATQILGCNDDIGAGNVTSELTLTNLAAGDYFVVVDSASNDGGPFALTFTTP
jgi:hypothetical protein